MEVSADEIIESVVARANPIGWISAGLLTGILLKFDKEVYTSVARGRKGNRRLASLSGRGG